MTIRGNIRARTFGLLAMSASSHLMVFSLLGLVPPPSRVLAMHESQFEVVEPPPPKVDPPKLKEPEPPPPEPVKAQPRRAAPQPSAAPPPPTPTAAPPAEEVADLTGVTLTADDGSASWSTVVGSGAAFKGPAGKIGRSTIQSQQQSAKVAPVGPRVVAVDSLSRKPEPPVGMNDLLKRNYPRRAQMLGVEGNAQMSLHILPNGRIANLRVLHETPSGYDFGAACRDTLKQAPPWVAPLDRSGTPVATDIVFKCSFEVEH